MTTVERVNKAWDRIEVWYQKNAPKWELPKGATDEEIDDLAAHLKVTFPEELRVSLKRHNGTEDGQWARVSLNSTKRIKSEWNTWTDLLKEGLFDDSTVESDGTYQAKYWCESWVPIDANGGGDGYIMDLAPGPKGKIGQILFLDHEEGPSGPKYPDYAGYLENIAEKLEKGNYTVIDNYLEETIASDKEEEGEGDEGEGEEEGDEEEDEEEEKEAKKKVKK